MGLRQVSSGWLQVKNQRKLMLARWLAVAREQFAGKSVTAHELTMPNVRPDLFSKQDEADKWLGELTKLGMLQNVFVRTPNKKGSWNVIAKGLTIVAGKRARIEVVTSEPDRDESACFGDLNAAWHAFMLAVAVGKAVKASTICEASPYFIELGPVETGHILRRLSEIKPQAPIRKLGGYSYTPLGKQLRERFMADGPAWSGHDTPLAQLLAKYGLDTAREYNLVLDEICGWASAREVYVILPLLIDARSIESIAEEFDLQLGMAKRYGHSGTKRLRKYAQRRRSELGLAPL